MDKPVPVPVPDGIRANIAGKEVEPAKREGGEAFCRPLYHENTDPRQATYATEGWRKLWCRHPCLLGGRAGSSGKSSATKLQQAPNTVTSRPEWDGGEGNLLTEHRPSPVSKRSSVVGGLFLRGSRGIVDTTHPPALQAGMPAPQCPRPSAWSALCKRVWLLGEPYEAFRWCLPTR
jgi:hypothetical protein